jgi:hypothetical protein
LLDGLDSAADGSGTQLNRAQMESIISRLGNRVFLMNNTHEDAPVIFQTRWALSYLRGPLTRDQIKILMDPVKSLDNTPPSPAPDTRSISGVTASAIAGVQAALPPDIPCFYVPARGNATAENKLLYLPRILGAAKINFSDKKAKIEMLESSVYLTPVTDDAIPVVWEKAQQINLPATDLEKTPQAGALFGALPSSASQSRNYSSWSRDFITWLYGTQKLELLLSPSLKQVSQPGETEQEFRIRLGQFAREHRDEAVELLRKKYAVKIATLQERLRKAQQTVEKQTEQAKQAKIQTAISIGSTLLGAFTGRKISSSTISRASTAMKGASRAADEKKDVDRAEETVDAIQKRLLDLQAEFDAEKLVLQAEIDPSSEILDNIVVKPNKTDIVVQLVALVWTPYWKDSQGTTNTPAW